MNRNRWVEIIGLIFLGCVMIAQERFASNQFLQGMEGERVKIEKTLQGTHAALAETSAITDGLADAASHAHTFGVALWSVPASVCLLLFAYACGVSHRLRRAEKLLEELKR